MLNIFSVLELDRFYDKFLGRLTGSKTEVTYPIAKPKPELYE